MKLKYRNTSKIMAPHSHGSHKKDMIVLHETVSSDVVGWSDIESVEHYLAQKDYGIHGVTDLEGRIAWASGLGQAIFWQCGGVNERSIGIEQVSNVMLRSPSNAVRRHIWVLRKKQLRATARLVAAIARAHKIQLKHSNGLHPGVTSHWNVSQHFAASEGHTDCWPADEGGYYPLKEVLRLAKIYYTLNYKL